MPKHPFVFKAKEYADEWNKDGEAARKKYTNQTIEITGVLAEVPGGGVAMTLSDIFVLQVVDSNDEKSSVECVTTEKELWARMAPGDKIKVSGTQISA
jgi:hypothetical protein